MRELLRQPRFDHGSTADQVPLLAATSEDWLDGMDLATDTDTATATANVSRVRQRARSEAADVMSAIDRW